MLFYLLYKLFFLTAFMCLLIQFKYGTKKTVIVVTVFSLLILILNYLIYLFFGSVTLGKVFPLTATVPAFIGFLLVSRSGVTKVLFSLLTVSIFSILARFVGQIPNIYWNSSLLTVLFEIMADIIILFFAFRLFRKPYLRILDALNSGWGVFCFVPGLLMALLFGLMYYPAPLRDGPEKVPLIIIAFALTFVFYLIVYLNFENITQHYVMKHDRQTTMLQMDMHKKEYETLQGSINAMKIYRHDMKHYLKALDTLLSDNNAVEALKFIRQLDGSLDNTVLRQYCENYFVNVILSSYIQKAEGEQIDVSCDVNIPEKTNIDPVEIGLIFANSIENAINACKKIDEADRRKLSIVCREQKGQLLIRVSNPYVGEIKFNGDFPISDIPEHGTGSKSIAAIAQKNGGVFSFTAQNGVFNAMVSFIY